jgi:hypothetical protein
LFAAAACVAIACGASAARADGGRVHRVATNPVYRDECGTCHVAFPPALLGASNWNRVLNGLPKHYGVDASVDAATLKTLAEWLTSNAAPKGLETPDDRITRSRWFVDQHREVPTSTWNRPSIKSAANCAACHANAAQGEFDEDRVRIPR